MRGDALLGYLVFGKSYIEKSPKKIRMMYEKRNYLSGTNLLESLACPSNLTLVYTYEDKRDLVTGMRIYRGAGTDVVLRNYTYDALGRPLTRTTSRNGTTQNDTFGYNPRSELTSATLGNANYAYAFDNIGNRETSSEAGTTLAYTANNLNQYTSIAQSSSSSQEEGDRAEGVVEALTYDTDGNATLVRTSTGTWSITYNGANRPVRFCNEETDTTVDCGYDSQGRRYFKKVTVAGTVTLHHRYIYRGYLQIACVDCTRSGHPALWLVTWDPSQATATRPLAIQKDGTWFTYGYDITKNVCEVFGPAGYIRTAYSYAPFGNVTESGDVSQPFQWSSEHYDSELDLVYYNYRHYSPSLGRFLSRDPIAEQGGLNLYAFVGNKTSSNIDRLGRSMLAPGAATWYPTPPTWKPPTTSKRESCLYYLDSVYAVGILDLILQGLALLYVVSTIEKNNTAHLSMANEECKTLKRQYSKCAGCCFVTTVFVEARISGTPPIRIICNTQTSFVPSPCEVASRANTKSPFKEAHTIIPIR